MEIWNKKETAYWIRLALFNLVIVALLGVLLRYKIAFSFPFLQQKHVLHGHSHFAFSAWISQMIMTLLLYHFKPQKSEMNASLLLMANTVVAFCMLLAFIYQGYGPYSIFFSSLSTLINFYFCFRVWRWIDKQNSVTTGDLYIKASIVFNFLSAIGTAYLVYLMINHISNPEHYLASVYYYLHFQYNGYFLFSCMGLFAYYLGSIQVQIPHERTIFWLFAGSLIPAYLLSIIWAHLPIYLFILVILSASVQFGAWFYWIYQIQKKSVEALIHPFVRKIWTLVVIAASIKFFLQMGSTIPSLSEFAFGFRPIVIAYLHLVLLGIVSLFLIGLSLKHQLISIHPFMSIALGVFIVGILLNETVLMLQGMSFLNLVTVPYSNELLFSIAIIMFSGAFGLYLSQKRARLKSE